MCKIVIAVLLSITFSSKVLACDTAPQDPLPAESSKEIRPKIKQNGTFEQILKKARINAPLLLVKTPYRLLLLEWQKTK
mgnify:CR=1 FL=1